MKAKGSQRITRPSNEWNMIPNFTYSYRWGKECVTAVTSEVALMERSKRTWQGIKHSLNLYCSSFITAQKVIKYQGTFIFKCNTSVLKNTEHCWEKLKKVQMNEKTYHVHGLEDTKLLGCQFSLYWFKVIRVCVCVCTQIDKLILKFMWKCKGLRIVKQPWKEHSWRNKTLL